jgi:ribonucleoside-diphosphate reductase alpha chain
VESAEADDVAIEVQNLAQSAPVDERPVVEVTAKPVESPKVGSSAELIEAMQGHASDAPLCMNCGTKMRPAGSCYVCEGCGSTSGCS